MDCSPSGSSVRGILQARILEWVAISYSRGSSWCRDWTYVSWVPCIGRQILYHCATWEALVNVSWGGKEQNLWCEVAKVLPWPSHHLSQRPLVSPWSSLGLTPCWDGVVLYCLFAQDDWPWGRSNCEPLLPVLWAQVTISAENLMLSALGQVCDCQNPLRRESIVLDGFIKPHNHICNSRKIVSPISHLPPASAAHTPSSYHIQASYDLTPNSPVLPLPSCHFFSLWKAAASDRIRFPLSWMINSRFISPNLSLEHLLQEVFQNSLCIYM